jgi:hypothetical protein
MKATASDTRLGDEFRLFARHLGERNANDYLASKYADAHAIRRIAPRTPFDAFILSVARTGSFGLWLADGFTGFFARKSIVRVKLVLTLALLESAAPSFERLDTPQGKGLGAWGMMFVQSWVFAFGLMLGALVFFPAKLWFALTTKERANA